jgi:hypothetical protein
LRILNIYSFKQVVAERQSTDIQMNQLKFL